MKPPDITSTINGIDLAMTLVGLIVGGAIGYLYGWLHYSGERKGGAQ